MSRQSKGLGGRQWLALVMFGLFGQIAWSIENMYFNVFLYKTVTVDPDAVAVMVAASAATATLTTLLMGMLSDKLGKRKPFIAFGYIIWGLVIMSFSLVSKQRTAQIFTGADPMTITAITAAVVVVLDCVMTFFGSTANDAAFNAWVTDITVPATRGRAEGVLSALPLLAMLVVFGLLDGLTQAGNWTAFFMIIGGMVTVGGVLGLILLKDNPDIKVEKTDLIYGFRPRVIKENKQLYIVLLILGLSAAAQQVFFPYIMIYLEKYLQIENYVIILGVILVAAAVLCVLGGRIVDKYGKRRFFVPAGVIYLAGLILMYLHGKFMKDSAASLPVLAVFGVMALGGGLLMGLVVNASIRDYTPEDKRGHFNGIRMIFAVLLPMIIGPFLGARIIKNGPQYLDEYGAAQYVPNPGIFLGAAALALLMFIPIYFAVKNMKKENIVN